MPVLLWIETLRWLLFAYRQCIVTAWWCYILSLPSTTHNMLVPSMFVLPCQMWTLKESSLHSLLWHEHFGELWNWVERVPAQSLKLSKGKAGIDGKRPWHVSLYLTWHRRSMNVSLCQCLNGFLWNISTHTKPKSPRIDTYVLTVGNK
jgi:hypothetical protein